MEKQSELCSPVACLRASRALSAAANAAACASVKAAAEIKYNVKNLKIRMTAAGKFLPTASTASRGKNRKTQIFEVKQRLAASG
jgi:hypothetical protein